MSIGIHEEPLLSVLRQGEDATIYTIEIHYMEECRTYNINSLDSPEILETLSRLAKHIEAENEAIRILLKFHSNPIFSIVKNDEHDYRIMNPPNSYGK